MRSFIFSELFETAIEMLAITTKEVPAVKLGVIANELRTR